MNTFKKLGGKDYCAYWFEAMDKEGRDGFSDAVRFDPHKPEVALEVRRYHHSLFDGFGTYMMMSKDLGDSYEFLDEISSPRPPVSVWKALLSPYQAPAHSDCKTRPIPWQVPVSPRQIGPGGFRGQIALEPELVQRARAHCAAIPCSFYTWVTWAIHQGVEQTLLAQPSHLFWTYMVSMRPWVALERIESNHISGLELVLGPDATPRVVADEVKTRFVKNDHWRAWYASRIGRLVGRWGVRQIYKRIHNLYHTAGHISHSGRVRNRTGQIWALSGIPSPGAPLNFNTQELNGHLAIGLRVDASFGFSAQAPNAQALLVAIKNFMIKTLDEAEQAACAKSV
ncbi:MAG: hypothetical protein KGL90_02945 [Burkholderiales bacterium]|nr:hypothetical protein [Burkholderiales bacterium]